MSDVTAYPLQWPVGRNRTPEHRRTRARFGVRRQVSGQNWTRLESLSIAEACNRLRSELDRADAKSVVISTNLTLRNDGLPRSGQREPEDPGVAVYYQRKGRAGCVSVDCWDRVADNLAASAQIIAAIRTMERLGGGEIVDQVFRGFAALPWPKADVETPEEAARLLEEWTAVPAGEVLSGAGRRQAFTKAVMRFHPDRNGGHEFDAWHRLQAAMRILEGQANS